MKNEMSNIVDKLMRMFGKFSAANGGGGDDNFRSTLPSLSAAAARQSLMTASNLEFDVDATDNFIIDLDEDDMPFPLNALDSIFDFEAKLGNKNFLIKMVG